MSRFDEKPSTPSASSAEGTNAAGGTHDAFPLQHALFPDDSYDAQGTYWADLKGSEGRKFINSNSGIEARREAHAVWTMFKADPLSPLAAYLSRYASNGMGLFVEGYVLFSIGNLQPLFAAAWPGCWGSTTTTGQCNVQWVNSVTYLEIIGIILGQIAVGIEGDWVGRRFGLIQDAAVMFLGVLLLMSVWGATLNGWVIGYAISLWFYGFGVGGEYPMTSTKALESGVPGPTGTRDDRLHRGRNVVLAFLMQGWGQVFNQSVLMLCLLIFHGGSTKPPYSPKLAQWTFRVSFGVIAILHLWLLYWRIYKMKTSDAVLRKAKKNLNTSGYDTVSLRLAVGHYGGRLLATTVGWFCQDVVFYGNKVFSGVFIKIIHPSGTVFTTWEYNLLNTSISLVGYYVAAMLIDHKAYGRRTMQIVGFAMLFLPFLFCAIFYDKLLVPGTPIAWFQTLYYLSSFFNQFGPNCTTFLVAAEVYPASIRASAHGVSAAAGKLGALLPTVVYHYVSNHEKFWIVPWMGLVGGIITYVWLPDTTGLDLREQERYWQQVRNGTPENYHGVAVHPRHLSWYEVHVLKRNKHYDAALDREDRIDELRVLYEAYLISKTKETSEEEHQHDYAYLTPDVIAYFEAEGSHETTQKKKERAISRAQRAGNGNHASLLEETVEK